MAYQPRPKFTPPHIARANSSPSVARHHHCLALIHAAATLLQGDQAITLAALFDMARAQHGQPGAGPRNAIPLPFVAITPQLLLEAGQMAAKNNQARVSAALCVLSHKLNPGSDRIEVATTSVEFIG